MSAAAAVVLPAAFVNATVSGVLGMAGGLLLLLAVPLSMLGTAVGGRLLDRMTDASFTSATRWVVPGIGAVYLTRAGVLAS